MTERQAPSDVADLVRRLREFADALIVTGNEYESSHVRLWWRQRSQLVVEAADALASQNQPEKSRPNGAIQTETGGRSPSLAPMNWWQPMDTAPKDAEVLVYDDGAMCLAIFDADVAAWIESGSGFTMRPAPTHWQSLPLPPESR